MSSSELKQPVEELTAPTTAEAALVDLERKEVKLSVHSDPGVFIAELDRIFARTWNFVAHESEIPDKGDFVSRYIGADPVLVVRQADGSVKVLLNSCTHKGAMVTREDKGCAARFTCPYHGFVYSADGQLVGMPYQKAVYGDIDRSEYALASARVESCAGLIFANWDPAAPTLDEYLGPYRTILETAFGVDSAMVIGPPQRWTMRGNWKLAAEQFSGDGYHTPATHGILFSPEGREATIYGVDFSVNGHGGRCLDLGVAFSGAEAGRDKLETESVQERILAHPPAGMTEEMLNRFFERATDEQLEMISRYPPTVGTVFPNFIWLNAETRPVEGEQIVMVKDLKILRPLNASECEIWTWTLVNRNSSAEHNREALRARTFTFGPPGIIERDDVDMWVRVQDAVEGAMGRQGVARYRALYEPDEKPLVPGMKCWQGASGENTSWHFFLRWRQFMNNELWG